MYIRTLMIAALALCACAPSLESARPQTGESVLGGPDRTDEEREANRAALAELRARAETAPQPPPAAEPPPVVVLAPELPQALTADGALKGSIVDAFVAQGPHALLGAVSVVPARQSTDGVSGFRIESFNRGGEFLTAAGLQVDDVVTRVNGRSIVMPDDFMAVWAGVPEAESLRVDVSRAGEPVVLEWVIDDSE